MCREPPTIDHRVQCVGWLWGNESNKYFFVRLLMAISCLVVLFFSVGWYATPEKVNATVETNCCVQYYLLYLTHWGLISENIYFLIMIYLQGQCLYNKSFNIHGKCNNIIFNTMKVFYSIGLTICFVFFIIYWPLFYPGNTEPDFLTLQILQHSVTPFIFLVEWFINLNQLKFKYAAWVTIYAVCYSIMHVLFYVFDGTAENGDPFIYSVFNFHSDPLTAAILLTVICDQHQYLTFSYVGWIYIL